MATKKKPPIQVANNTQKRMTRGADDQIHSSTRKSLNEVPENSSIPCEDKNITDHNDLSSQDDQANTTSTLNSLRAEIDSELNTAYLSAGTFRGKDVSSSKMGVGNGTMCFCAPQSSGSPGQKKADEMIDYTMKNLNEAGKALTNLGENFEQDLKLMFMDIMGRVQHWVSVVENRICAASADLELLRKDSIAGVSDLTEKELELVVLRKKLAEAEASLAAQEKELEVTGKAPANPVAEQEKTTTTAQSDPGNDNAMVDGNILETRTPITLVDTASQFVEDREKGKADREAELEEELAQLREENERLLEERMEYENSVQCALLRGVSSLNIEAFKVLRCPPIPCCTPCAHIPPCSISQEPIVVSCHPRNPAKRLDAVPQPAQRGSKTVPRSEKTCKTRIRNGPGTNICSQQHSEHLLNCNGDDKRSCKNGVILFLHHGDAANLCQPCMKPQPETYGSTSNRDNVCVGGKCKKLAAGQRDRVLSPRRSSGSRPESRDIYFRSRDETRENSTAKRNAVTTKRWGPFDTNHCNRED